MNKGLFYAEGLKFFDISVKEKLDEFDAPPWSPNIEKLSPIKKLNTAFCNAVDSCALYSFNKSKLEFKSPEQEEDSSQSMTSENFKESLPSTPVLRKPIKVIMSRIRRINFDLPEDYELQVKSTTADNERESEGGATNETKV